MIHLLLIVLLADIPGAATTAIGRYKSTLADLESKKKGASVQKVFDAALAVQKGLEGAELSDDDRASLRKAVPALREDMTIDAAFFAELTSKYGNAADADFFRTYVPATSPACTKFDELLTRYKAWFAFSRKHNPAYRSQVIDEIARIENAFTTSTCACDDAEAVRRALSETARDFPLGKITPKVRQRIAGIDRGESDIRFNCE